MSYVLTGLQSFTRQKLSSLILIQHGGLSLYLFVHYATETWIGN